jgi:pimeloyl-ACP methyl ester carboxylesterase
VASARYGWPLYVIEDAGDDPAMEQPEAFLEALRSSLADARV